jgi:hypothetical protein
VSCLFFFFFFSFWEKRRSESIKGIGGFFFKN